MVTIIKKHSNITSCINKCLDPKCTVNCLQLVGDDGTLLEQIAKYNYARYGIAYKPIKITFGCWSTSTRNTKSIITNLKTLISSLSNCGGTFIMRYRGSAKGEKLG
eukprot:378669_1